jgi:four helix bundle protein
MKSYRDLVVWQRAMEFVVTIYEETQDFPRSETYGLVSQMRRASVSIPSNIAEGHGRRTSRQRFKFLEDALGSVYELECQIELAARLRFLHPENAERLLRSIGQIGRGLTGLMRFVETEARSQPRTRTQTPE